MARYPHLVLHRRRWMVRLIVPADVRPIIAELKNRIQLARLTVKKPIETQADELAAVHEAQRTTDPTAAQTFALSDVVALVLQQQGHSWADYGRQVRVAGWGPRGYPASSARRSFAHAAR